MPSPWVKKIARETGKSEREIEKIWKKAKEITSEEFGKSEDDFGNKEYSYTTGVVKKMLGVDESILDPSKFLESEHSAKEYIETLVSGNFSIGNVLPPEENDDEDEDDYEEEYEEDPYEDDDFFEDEEEMNNYYETSPRFSEEELSKIEKESLRQDVKESSEEIKKKDIVEKSNEEVDSDYVKHLDSILETLED